MSLASCGVAAMATKHALTCPPLCVLVPRLTADADRQKLKEEFEVLRRRRHEIAPGFEEYVPLHLRRCVPACVGCMRHALPTGSPPSRPRMQRRERDGCSRSQRAVTLSPRSPKPGADPVDPAMAPQAAPPPAPAPAPPLAAQEPPPPQGGTHSTHYIYVPVLADPNHAAAMAAQQMVAAQHAAHSAPAPAYYHDPYYHDPYYHDPYSGAPVPVPSVPMPAPPPPPGYTHMHPPGYMQYPAPPAPLPPPAYPYGAPVFMAPPPYPPHHSSPPLMHVPPGPPPLGEAYYEYTHHAPHQPPPPQQVIGGYPVIQ